MFRRLSILFILSSTLLFLLISTAFARTADIPWELPKTLNGVIADGEYKGAQAFTFPTHGGSATVYLAEDVTYLWVAVDVPNDGVDTSYVDLYIDKNDDHGNAPQTDDLLLAIRKTGTLSEYVGTGAVWSLQGSQTNWTAQRNLHGDGSWSAEFRIEYAKLGLTAGTYKQLGFSIANYATLSGNYAWGSGWSATTPATWQNIYSTDAWWDPRKSIMGHPAPTFDGQIGNSEYSYNTAITYIEDTGYGYTYVICDGNYVYVSGYIYDVVSPNQQYSIYFDVNNNKTALPDANDKQLIIKPDGTTQEKTGTGAAWGAAGDPLDWSGLVNSTAWSWTFETRIAYSKLGLTAGTDKQLGFAIARENTTSGNFGYPYSYYSTKPNSWATIRSGDDEWQITIPTVDSLTSSTHPSSTAYYTRDDPIFLWTSSDPYAVYGYSYRLNRSSGTIPDTTADMYFTTTKSYSNIANGKWYFHLRACDYTNNWSSASHIRILVDDYKPRTYAPRRASIRRGARGRLYWRVYDPYTGGRVRVTLKIRRRGRTYRAYSLGLKTINRLKYYTYRANLPRGTYRYYVYAKDQAGNNQYRAASNYLVIM